MNNIKNNIFIGIITFILCIIITVISGINFFWLIVPIIFIALVVFLSAHLRERFGKTYGIIVYFVLLFVVPIIWYLFSSSMPITSKTLESQQKAEDLSAFQKYQGSVDAKKEVAHYQMKQDSILREQVSLLLSEGKVDSALMLIKQNETSSEKIKQELFSSIPQSSITGNIDQTNNSTLCGDYPEGSTRYLNESDVSGRTKATLRVMRNEIFMRYGYIFKSDDLSQHFSKFNCYKPQHADVTHMLSVIEKTNIDFIKRYEEGSVSQNGYENFGGQPAFINDPDGYTNIRSSQGKNYSILGIIRTGEEFYTRVNYSEDWWQVKTKNGIIGYVHKSRIQLER